MDALEQRANVRTTTTKQSTEREREKDRQTIQDREGRQTLKRASSIPASPSPFASMMPLILGPACLSCSTISAVMSESRTLAATQYRGQRETGEKRNGGGGGVDRLKRRFYGSIAVAADGEPGKRKAQQQQKLDGSLSGRAAAKKRPSTQLTHRYQQRQQ